LGRFWIFWNFLLLEISCFSFLGGGCRRDRPFNSRQSTPGQVWLTAEATAANGDAPAFQRGHTPTNGDPPRGECALLSSYSFIKTYLHPSVLPLVVSPLSLRCGFYFLLSYWDSLLFCSFFVSRAPSSLCTSLEHTLCSLACPCGASCSLRGRLPSSTMRSLASHPRPLRRDSNFFSFGVHLSTQLPGFVSRPPVSLERFVVASTGFWCWCAWRRKEFFWNLSFRFVRLPASLPTFLSPPPQMVFCFWVLVFVRAFRLMFLFSVRGYLEARFSPPSLRPFCVWTFHSPQTEELDVSRLSSEWFCNGWGIRVKEWGQFRHSQVTQLFV